MTTRTILSVYQSIIYTFIPPKLYSLYPLFILFLLAGSKRPLAHFRKRRVEIGSSGGTGGTGVIVTDEVEVELNASGLTVQEGEDGAEEQDREQVSGGESKGEGGDGGERGEGGDTDSVTDSVAIRPFVEGKPDSKAELLTWLENRKAAWRQTRAHTKAEEIKTARRYGQVAGSGRNDFDQHYYANQTSSSTTSKKPIGVLDFVRNASLEAAYGYWQIVEV